MTEFPTGTITFLFTDVESWTLGRQPNDAELQVRLHTCLLGDHPQPARLGRLVEYETMFTASTALSVNASKRAHLPSWLVPSEQLAASCRLPVSVSGRAVPGSEAVVDLVVQGVSGAAR